MKPFNLEAAKRGEPIVTRDGRKVTFVSHVPGALENQRVVYLRNGKICIASETGRFYGSDEDCESEDIDDLFMAPKKKTVWINLYENRHTECRWFVSRETADDAACVKGWVRVGNKAWPLEIEE